MLTSCSGSTVTDTPIDTATDSVTDTANDAVTNTVTDTVSDKGLGLQGCFIDTWMENKRNKKDMKRTTENDMVSQTDSGTCDSPQHDSITYHTYHSCNGRC